MTSIPNEAEVNFFEQGTRMRQHNDRKFRSNNFRSSNRNAVKPKGQKCRSCQSTDRLFRACPTRYCQACGHRGNDAWDRCRPNYEL